ncbi:MULTISPECIES: hypothetical protein [Sinorhizobium/Ensifer group]|jgi:hypothetical protein|nr:MULTISPECIES: hypothetical protein [Sinorhizobium/Ensifer group]MBD9506962.1 hypothetical protein [Ensifer sp. ENS10]MBV7517194.1 hypothetical protein [Ensifer sp. ENS12]
MLIRKEAVEDGNKTSRKRAIAATGKFSQSTATPLDPSGGETQLEREG